MANLKRDAKKTPKPYTASSFFKFYSDEDKPADEAAPDLLADALASQELQRFIVAEKSRARAKTAKTRKNK